MNLFNKSEIHAAISAVAEEKDKLAQVHQQLWKIFKGIAPDESSANVWQERLREYDVRKDFYEKLSAFAKWWTSCTPAMNCLKPLDLNRQRPIARTICSSRN